MVSSAFYKKSIQVRVFACLFVLTGFTSLLQVSKTLTSVGFINTTFVFFIQFCFVLLLLWFTVDSCNKNKSILPQYRIVLAYLMYLLFHLLTALFIAETYWDYKLLVDNAFFLFLPMIVFVTLDSYFIKVALSAYFIFGVLIFICLLPVLPAISYGYYLMPFTFFLMFFPIVNNRVKLLTAILFVIVISDTSSRSNLIKYIIPAFMGLLCIYRYFIPILLFRFTRMAFFILPLVLLLLASTNIFNVFKMDQYISGEHISSQQFSSTDVGNKNLLGDTRSFIYEEVYYSSIQFNSWLFGRTPTRGYISDYFGDDDMNGRGERNSSEVNILNIFTWTGIVGLSLFSFIFFHASNLAINYSNNIYCKFLGVFIAFKWMYGWVEEFSNFDINFLMTWIFVGMCLSPQFRKFSDVEFESFIKQIPNIKFKITN